MPCVCAVLTGRLAQITKPLRKASNTKIRQFAQLPDLNVIVGLIKVTCYLLDQQLRRLERDFIENGGLRERMTRARLGYRSRSL